MFEGAPDGSFSDVRRVGGRLLGLGDIDGDGVDDLGVVVPERVAGVAMETLIMHLSLGDVGFAKRLEVRSADLRERPYALADYDGDGLCDAVFLAWPTMPHGGHIRILSKFRAGRWEESIRIAYPDAPGSEAHYLNSPPLYIGDLDLDGCWDVGVAMGSYYGLAGKQSLGVRVLSASGHGELWQPRTRHFPERSWAVPAVFPQTRDLDGDTVPDAVFLDANVRSGTRVLVYRGVPGHMPVLEGAYAVRGRGCTVRTADVDGDGDWDIVVLSEAPEGSLVTVLRSQVANTGGGPCVGAIAANGWLWRPPLSEASNSTPDGAFAGFVLEQEALIAPVRLEYATKAPAVGRPLAPGSRRASRTPAVHAVVGRPRSPRPRTGAAVGPALTLAPCHTCEE